MIELVQFEQADASSRGHAHGELWRPEIAELAEIRVGLTINRSAFDDVDQVLDVARLHLDELARVDPDQHAELVGIARGADLDPARVIVLNHYTDLRDVPRSVLGPEAGQGAPPPGDDPGGCTALYVNGSEGPILAQTWDMHGTAAPFVRLIRVTPAGSDLDVLCFTLTGCLGMTGLTSNGLAVSINNLTSTDAQVGVVWPALVRRMLTRQSAAQARDHLLAARLSSGHHYMIADEDDFFGVETSGQHKVETQHGAQTAHVHTNHCFDPVLRGAEKILPTSTTYRRMELATTAYAQQRPETAEEVWRFLSSHEGFPKSICSHVDDVDGDPSASRTCGLMVMRLRDRTAWAVRGCPQENDRREVTLR